MVIVRGKDQRVFVLVEIIPVTLFTPSALNRIFRFVEKCNLSSGGEEINKLQSILAYTSPKTINRINGIE